MKELKVVVDQRERASHLPEHLHEHQLNVVMQTLPIGDYLISDRVCIERKTVSDFESSIISGRLFDQAERLKQHYQSPIIILEGDSELFRLHRRVIIGTIATLYIDYGIEVLLSGSQEETAEIISSLAKHEQDGHKREPSAKGGLRAYTTSQYQEYMVANLPGVGMVLARSLLKHFGSLKGLANATPEDLMKIEKIGKKKAERIFETLNERYSGESVD
ncbi:MAG: hypothetical protein KGH98_02335 [Candidatus Micrarchaeota archaeon]|nr:hypothetical protein [Candidatus Micrarchaeota archaeon]